MDEANDREAAVRLGVDVGGTFTDVVLVDDDGMTTAKVPTTADPSVGVVEGVERATTDAGRSPSSIASFRHATTVAVNALLEDAVAPTALVTTEGFADVLAIGRQARPDLYDATAQRPAPIVPTERRYGVPERATVEGVERPVDTDAVADVAEEIERADTAEAVAVSFLHAYAHPENEARAASILRERLAIPVVASHEVLPTFREYERTATTVADAGLAPVVGDYLDRVTDRAADVGLPNPRIMQANGGIAAAEAVRESPVTTAMSGPAAGVVGASAFEPAAAEGLVTLDMGGTSTDVSLVRDGEVERTSEANVSGRPVRIPMVDVETVGAGGGSIAHVDSGGALRVGPASAGADPGPVCYGRGGTEPTVTDAAVVLGYLGADTTLGGDLTLDAAAARDALAALAEDADLADAVAAARGVYRVAGATTTRAVRRVTVERGHDPRAMALAAFGGAGPMVGAAVADRLDVAHVVVPPASGVLSAVGLLAADEQQDAVRTLRTPLADADPDTVEAAYDGIAERARDRLTEPVDATVERRADCRYAGQSHELTVDVPADWDADAVAARFHAAHERERGYRLEDEPIELVQVRVVATIPGTPPRLSHDVAGEARTGTREVHFEEARETPVYDRAGLAVGESRDGPAIVEGGESTCVCPPGWSVRVDERGSLHLEVVES